MSQANAIRRDAEPDRVHLLKVVVVTAVVLGVMALCTALPCLVGLPLSVAGSVMAARDRAKMDSGLMDPRAGEDLDGIQALGTFALGTNLVALCWWFIVLASFFLVY
jgi:hypothetical protein